MSESLRDVVKDAYEQVEESESIQKEEIAESVNEEAVVEHAEAHEKASSGENDGEHIIPPEHWSSDDKELFKSIDTKGQKFLLKRHKEMEAAYTKKQQSLADESRIAESFKKTISPYEGYLRQLNRDPNQAIQDLLATEMRLRTAPPHEKAALLKKLARDYNVSFENNDAPELEIDPKTQVLLNELEEQRRQIQAIQYERHMQIQNGYHQQVSSFQNTKDAQGNPKYPHFERVRAKMGDLLRSEIIKDAQGNPVTDLEEIYEQAILLDKDLRDSYRSQQSMGSSISEDSRKKAEASKKAGFNVRPASRGPVTDPKKTLSLRQTIAQAMEASNRN